MKQRSYVGNLIGSKIASSLWRYIILICFSVMDILPETIREAGQNYLKYFSQGIF